MTCIDKEQATWRHLWPYQSKANIISKVTHPCILLVKLVRRDFQKWLQFGTASIIDQQINWADALQTGLGGLPVRQVYTHWGDGCTLEQCANTKIKFIAGCWRVLYWKRTACTVCICVPPAQDCPGQLVCASPRWPLPLHVPEPERWPCRSLKNKVVNVGLCKNKKCNILFKGNVSYFYAVFHSPACLSQTAVNAKFFWKLIKYLSIYQYQWPATNK